MVTCDTLLRGISLLVSNSSYKSGAAVTPSNTVDLTNVASALWVGGTGNVKVDMTGTDGVTFTAVPAGTLLKIQVTRVYLTGTDATNIVALW